jgi:hypothetical protein
VTALLENRRLSTDGATERCIVGEDHGRVVLQIGAIQEPRRRKRCELIQGKAASGEVANAAQAVGGRDGGALTHEELRYSHVGQLQPRLVQLEAGPKDRDKRSIEPFEPGRQVDNRADERCIEKQGPAWSGKGARITHPEAAVAENRLPQQNVHLRRAAGT